MRCHMDSEKMMGTSFDGASPITVFAKLIKSEVGPQALYVHCLTHCSELVFKDAIETSPTIACAQDLMRRFVCIGWHFSEKNSGF